MSMNKISRKKTFTKLFWASLALLCLLQIGFTPIEVEAEELKSSVSNDGTLFMNEPMRWFLDVGHSVSKNESQLLGTGSWGKSPYSFSVGWVSAHYHPKFRFAQKFRASYGIGFLSRLSWLPAAEFRAFGGQESAIYLQAGMGPRLSVEHWGLEILGFTRAEGRLHLGKNIQLTSAVELGLAEALIDKSYNKNWFLISMGVSFVY